MPIGLITGAMSLVGSLVGDSTAASGQQATNAMQMQLAQKQMDFQKASQQESERYDTEMSNTAVQRRMADLQAAGLNPQLAVGNPASSPQVSSASGAQAQLQNPEAPYANLGSQVSGAVGAGSAAAQAATAQANSAAQINQANANAANLDADTRIKNTQAGYTAQSIETVNSKLSAETRQLNEQTDGIERANLLQARIYGDKVQQEDAKAALAELQIQLNHVDLLRQQLGLPRLQNDAAWQANHPELSGWLQSGAAGAASAVGLGVSSAARAAEAMIP